jgi:hypothetical protein
VGTEGSAGVLDDVFITAKLHEERESHYPFGVPGRRSVFTPERTVQTVYASDDGLIRREDYDVDIMGDATGVHYMSGYTRVDGIMLPTGHRIFPRTPEGRPSPTSCWSRSISARSHSRSRLTPRHM